MVDEKMEPLEYLRKLRSQEDDATRMLLKDVAESVMNFGLARCTARPI